MVFFCFGYLLLVIVVIVSYFVAVHNVYFYFWLLFDSYCVLLLGIGC